MCGIYLTNILFGKSKIADKLKSIEFRRLDNLGYEKVNDERYKKQYYTLCRARMGAKPFVINSLRNL